MCCLTPSAVRTASGAIAANELARFNPGGAGAGLTGTLPAPTAGRLCAVSLTGTFDPRYPVTVASTSGLVGDGVTQTLRSIDEVLTVVGDGTNWLIVDWFLPSKTPAPEYVLSGALQPLFQSKMGATPGTDISGNGRNLASVGGAVTPVRPVNAIDSGAYVTTSRLNRTDAATRLTGAVTVEALIRTMALVGSSQHYIGQVGNPATGGANNWLYGCTFDGTGPSLFWQTGAGGVVSEVKANRVLEPGRLQHVVWTRQSDGRTVAIYADGVTIASGVGASAPDMGSTSTFNLFSDANAGGIWQGFTWGCALYNYAWTADMAAAMARLRLGQAFRSEAA